MPRKHLWHFCYDGFSIMIGLGKVFMIQLFQFPISHYCEKVRWALDHKGIPYRIVNVLPGFHRQTIGKLAPKTCVPVLCDDELVVQDSTAIINYLDARYPNPPLTPGDPDASRKALEWEEYLDEEIGVTLRLWFYYHLLPDHRLALKFLLKDAPAHEQPHFMLAYPEISQAMIRHMNISAETASQSEQRLCAAFDRLDEALDGRSFLVEDRFSRADLTACALLSPCCLREDREFPAAALNFRTGLKERRFYRWVRTVYDSHRRCSTGGQA